MVNRSSIETNIRKKKIGLIFIILLFLTIIFFILLTQTDIFNIKSVQIEGNETLDSEKILLASGIILKENIFKINLNAVRNNLMLHPYIKEANAYRKIPSKILIKVVERKELLAISYIGSYIYVDDEGYAVNILSSTKDSVPVIEGMDIKSVIIGEKLILNDSKVSLTEILEFVKKCKTIGLFSIIDIIYISDNFLNIHIKDEGIVAFGSLNNVEYKLSFLYEILSTLNKDNVKFKLIDLDKAEDAIIVTEDN